HLSPRLLLEDRLCEQGGDEVARDEVARVVDEEAAVRVSVVGDAEIAAFVARLRDDELAVLGEQRVRLVTREGAVGLEVALDDVELGESSENRGQHGTGHS